MADEREASHSGGRRHDDVARKASRTRWRDLLGEDEAAVRAREEAAAREAAAREAERSSGSMDSDEVVDAVTAAATSWKTWTMALLGVTFLLASVIALAVDADSPACDLPLTSFLIVNLVFLLFFLAALAAIVAARRYARTTILAFADSLELTRAWYSAATVLCVIFHVWMVVGSIWVFNTETCREGGNAPAVYRVSVAFTIAFLAYLTVTHAWRVILRLKAWDDAMEAAREANRVYRPALRESLTFFLLLLTVSFIVAAAGVLYTDRNAPDCDTPIVGFVQTNLVLLSLTAAALLTYALFNHCCGDWLPTYMTVHSGAMASVVNTSVFAVVALHIWFGIGAFWAFNTETCREGRNAEATYRFCLTLLAIFIGYLTFTALSLLVAKFKHTTARIRARHERAARAADGRRMADEAKDIETWRPSRTPVRVAHHGDPPAPSAPRLADERASASGRGDEDSLFDFDDLDKRDRFSSSSSDSASRGRRPRDDSDSASASFDAAAASSSSSSSSDASTTEESSTDETSSS